jgi:hypothetical protein
LPTIVGNFAEGFVLKPDVRIGAMERPVIKRKLPEFDDSRSLTTAALYSMSATLSPHPQPIST